MGNGGDRERASCNIWPSQRRQSATQRKPPFLSNAPITFGSRSSGALLQTDLTCSTFRHVISQIAPPLQFTFSEVMRHIALRTGVVVVVGSAGTGKTLLLQLLEEACASNGLSVRLVDRGDLAYLAVGERCDLLLVDEADWVSAELLQTLMSPQTRAAVSPRSSPALTFRQPGFATDTHPELVRLDGLTEKEAEKYVQVVSEPGLFSPDAVKLLASAAGGSVRMLRSVASFAISCAGRNGRSQVSFADVQETLANRTISPQDSTAPIAQTLPLAETQRESDSASALDEQTKRGTLIYGRPWSFARAGLAAAGSGAIAAIAVIALLQDDFVTTTLSGRTMAGDLRPAMHQDMKQFSAALDVPVKQSGALAPVLGRSITNLKEIERSDAHLLYRPLVPSTTRNLVRPATVQIIFSPSPDNSIPLNPVRLSGLSPMADIETTIRIAEHRPTLDLVLAVRDINPLAPNATSRGRSSDQGASITPIVVTPTSFSVVPLVGRIDLSNWDDAQCMCRIGILSK